MQLGSQESPDDEEHKKPQVDGVPESAVVERKRNQDKELKNQYQSVESLSSEGASQSESSSCEVIVKQRKETIARTMIKTTIGFIICEIQSTEENKSERLLDGLQ